MIYPAERVRLTDEEAAGRIAEYGLGIYRSGTRLWIRAPWSKDHGGTYEQITMPELIDILDAHTYRGERILGVIASRTFPGYLSFAYTEAGKQWYRDMAYYRRRRVNRLRVGE